MTGSSTVNFSEVDAWIEKLLNCKHLTEKEIEFLCAAGKFFFFFFILFFYF